MQMKLLQGFDSPLNQSKSGMCQYSEDVIMQLPSCVKHNINT